MKILMVCLGNICRSPIAEGVMQKMISENDLDWTVDSASTNTYHTGEAPHRFSQKICKQHGIDISQQRARRFTTADFDKYDRIYVMADDVYREVSKWARNAKDMEKVHYFLDELHPNKKESVPDPWYGGEEGFAPVYEVIEKTCKALISNHAKDSKLSL